MSPRRASKRRALWHSQVPQNLGWLQSLLQCSHSADHSMKRCPLWSMVQSISVVRGNPQLSSALLACMWRGFRCNMNELVLFYEQTHLTPYSPSVFFDSWSHWGELNPRPSPYQGDAIPLSHSGDAPSIDGADLIATMGPDEFGQTTGSSLAYRSSGRQPRSHSPVLRMTGNHVGFSLGSSNLPLGATSHLRVWAVSN